MSRLVFINLAVQDLARARDFWTALGFGFNDQYSDENALCMVLSETVSVMLLSHPTFSRFTTRPIADPHAVTEGLYAFTCESREAVDAVVGTAIAHGGRPAMAAQDHGFMYAWSFYDPDGHHWEPFWMDPEGPSDEGDEREDDGA
jgi:predicted lactoylglutathione lyase